VQIFRHFLWARRQIGALDFYFFIGYRKGIHEIDEPEQSERGEEKKKKKEKEKIPSFDIED
jgi:hypothetical protein